MGVQVGGGFLSALRRGFTAVRGAVSRGLSSLGIESMLERVGLLERERPDAEQEEREERLRGRRRLEYVSAMLRPAAIHERQYSMLAPGALPPTGLLRTALTRMHRRYAWVVEVDVQVRDTDALEVRTVTVSSSRLMSKFEILAAAEPMVRTSPVEVLRSRIVEGIQANERGSIL